MEQKNYVQQGAIKYLALIMCQRLIGICLFWGAAGTFRDIRSTTNLALYLIISIIVSIMMLSSHQETLHERGKKQENTKEWDKFLLPIIVILSYYGIYLIAGLGVRFRWRVLPIEWFYIGIVIYLISSIFTVWPVLVNKYFESTARNQANRGQTVIQTGPYRIMRHPGYAGIILWAIASAFMFGTLAVGITSFIIIITIWVRTYLEDNMLKEELDGYLEYSKKVRYRLIPFVW